jgi:hypothetical protein
VFFGYFYYLLRSPFGTPFRRAAKSAVHIKKVTGYRANPDGFEVNLYTYSQLKSFIPILDASHIKKANKNPSYQ